MIKVCLKFLNQTLTASYFPLSEAALEVLCHACLYEVWSKYSEYNYQAPSSERQAVKAIMVHSHTLIHLIGHCATCGFSKSQNDHDR